jgi:hypothetical protein
MEPPGLDGGSGLGREALGPGQGSCLHGGKRGPGGILIRALREGLIPERICLNDAKMNNILIDNTDSQTLEIAGRLA